MNVDALEIGDLTAAEAAVDDAGIDTDADARGGGRTDGDATTGAVFVGGLELDACGMK